jgi:O-antigen/teichoic acid export membrane protein
MRGYLPALMFMSVLRPRFIGLYALTGTLRVVAAEAVLASQLSTLTIAPLVAIVVLYGDELIGLASGGKIASGQWLLATLMCSLIPRVHRQISVVLANCVGRARLLISAALIALFGLPLAWWVGITTSAVWGAAVAVVWDEVVWVVVLVAGLQNAGYLWGGNWGFALRAMLASAVVALCVSLMPLSGSLLDLVLGSGLVLSGFVVAVLVTRILRVSDLGLFRRK